MTPPKIRLVPSAAGRHHPGICEGIAAHGGFCSVNMAAGMIYTLGGSFWEFGGPDLDRARLFVMIGTAEDHHSNPLKIAISKFKRSGGKFISINPIRTGYSAIADEWVPIKPGTDGALLLALNREIVKQGIFDRDFLLQYTNAAQLVNVDQSSDQTGLFVRTDEPVEEGSPLTVINYTLLGCASGFTLATGLIAHQSPQSAYPFSIATVVFALTALVTRGWSLLRNTRIKPRATVQSAIGVHHSSITQQAVGFMGGSFNTREFFHGVSHTLFRSVKWVFLILVFPVPLLLLTVGIQTESVQTNLRRLSFSTSVLSRSVGFSSPRPTTRRTYTTNR